MFLFPILKLIDQKKYFTTPACNNLKLSRFTPNEINYTIFQYKYLYRSKFQKQQQQVLTLSQQEQIMGVIQNLTRLKEIPLTKKKSIFLHLGGYLREGYLQQQYQFKIPTVQITGTRTNIFLNCYLPETNSTFTWHLGAFWKHWFRQGPSPILYAFAKHSLLRLVEVYKLPTIRLIFRNLPVYKQRKLLYALKDRRLQINYLSRESSRAETPRVFNGIKLKHKRRKHLRQRQAFIKPIATPTKFLSANKTFKFNFLSTNRSPLFQFKSKPFFFFKVQKHFNFLLQSYKHRNYRYTFYKRKLKVSVIPRKFIKKLKHGRVLSRVLTQLTGFTQLKKKNLFWKVKGKFKFPSFRYIPQFMAIKFNYIRWFRGHIATKFWKQRRWLPPKTM